jgi:hypothetical protein
VAADARVWAPRVRGWSDMPDSPRVGAVRIDLELGQGAVGIAFGQDRDEPSLRRRRADRSRAVRRRRAPPGDVETESQRLGVDAPGGATSTTTRVTVSSRSARARSRTRRTMLWLSQATARSMPHPRVLSAFITQLDVAAAPEVPLPDVLWRGTLLKSGQTCVRSRPAPFGIARPVMRNRAPQSRRARTSTRKHSTSGPDSRSDAMARRLLWRSGGDGRLAYAASHTGCEQSVGDRHD